VTVPSDAHDLHLVIDLEATCTDDGTVPGEEMEIIEIGAVLWSRRLLDSVSELQTFVRPIRHPRLTPFCTGLTHIAQADVDAAPAFPDAVARLRSWMGGFDTAIFCSWGDYDRKQFQQDCRFHAVAYPFGEAHLNLKRAAADILGARKTMRLRTALRHAGLTFQGTHHRGIDDARNIARVLEWLATGGHVHRTGGHRSG
jgi:inhibitor of KinA sporulation pathway (predicted exonuclease)